MRDIEFIKVGMKNFAGYHGEDFELSFENGKLILITGPNGCIVGDSEIDMPRDLSNSTSGIKIKELIDKEVNTYCYAFFSFQIHHI